MSAGTMLKLKFFEVVLHHKSSHADVFSEAHNTDCIGRMMVAALDSVQIFHAELWDITLSLQTEGFETLRHTIRSTF